MTKQELRTGMMVEFVNGWRYMVYECEDGVIDFIPIGGSGLLMEGLFLSWKKDLNPDTKHSPFKNIDGLELRKIWRAKSGSDLLYFRDEDLIWEL